MNEEDFLALLRASALPQGARGLMDDAAVIYAGSGRLVLTHDTLVEGVHFLPDDPAEDVAWKLLAVNLSDLAAKGAEPVGALMSYSLTGNAGWDEAFARGFLDALAWYGVPLLGGDTVAARERHLGVTLIGRAGGPVPSRGGGHAGDALFVTGTIGDAGAGLALARAGMAGDAALVSAYRRPAPQLAAGRVLAPLVTAMMDVSDGLLIDAARLARASGVAAHIDLDAVPLSRGYVAAQGDDRAARIAAVTAGDDYQLLFASALPLPGLPCTVTRIGQLARGQGLVLHDAAGPVPLPASLGWTHAGC